MLAGGRAADEVGGTEKDSSVPPFPIPPARAAANVEANLQLETRRGEGEMDGWEVEGVVAWPRGVDWTGAGGRASGEGKGFSGEGDDDEWSAFCPPRWRVHAPGAPWCL